ncbi:MAG: efflux RND transporter permease subunit, partial [Gemmatimonadaceae bacterium]|nr:efflux RND transporter permease subunit [Gloeobacterales cyanobacterium ES-bin-141]
MLNRLILWSLSGRWLVVAASVVLLGLGIATAIRMPLDVFPNFAPPRVVIQTTAPGLAPEEVESLVTLPMESALNGTPGLADIRSASSVGLSTLTVIFEGDTDILRARQLISERLGQVTARLPEGANTLLLPTSSPVGVIIRYALTMDPNPVAGRTDLLDIATLANWQIRNRLLAIPGVANV